MKGIGWLTEDDLDVLAWYYEWSRYGKWVEEKKRPARQYAHRNELFVKHGLMEQLDQERMERRHRLTPLGLKLAREIVKANWLLLERLTALYNGEELKTGENASFCTTAQAAQMSGEHERTWRKRCARGQIPDAIKYGAKWLIPTGYVHSRKADEETYTDNSD